MEPPPVYSLVQEGDLEAQNFVAKQRPPDVVFEDRKTSGHKCPGYLCFWFYSWYVAYFYSLIIVIGFSGTTFSNIIIKNDHSGRSWLPVAKSLIESLESVAPGATQNISYSLLGEVPDVHDTYYLNHFGLCRENNRFERTCYRGEGPLRLIAQDLAVQVAKPKEGEEFDAFVSQWNQGYSMALKEASAAIKRHTFCSKRSLGTLFRARCQIDGLDLSAVRVVRHLEHFSGRSYGTKLWIAATVFFSMTLLAEMSNIVNQVTAFGWKIGIIGNFITVVMYLSSFSIPDIYQSIEHGPELEMGSLRSIFFIILALRICCLISAIFYITACSGQQGIRDE